MSSVFAFTFYEDLALVWWATIGVGESNRRQELKSYITVMKFFPLPCLFKPVRRIMFWLALYPISLLPGPPVPGVFIARQWLRIISSCSIKSLSMYYWHCCWEATHSAFSLKKASSLYFICSMTSSSSLMMDVYCFFSSSSFSVCCFFRCREPKPVDISTRSNTAEIERL